MGLLTQVVCGRAMAAQIACRAGVARFVKRHKLAVQPCSQSIELADGGLQTVSGVVKVELCIDKAVTATTLLISNLTPGFDVILGDDWSTRHRILADYGYNDPVRGEYCRANLLLRCIDKRVWPGPEDPITSHTKLAASSCVIGARQAARLLAIPAAGCRPAFLVTVRAVPEVSGESEPPDSSNEALDEVLRRCETVFDPPDASAVRPELAPEAVPLPRAAKAAGLSHLDQRATCA